MRQQLSLNPNDNVRFSVDMVKVEIENVKMYDWNNFLIATEFERVDIWLKNSVKDFRYNCVFQDDAINPSDTTIFIGYEHNASIAKQMKQEKVDELVIDGRSVAMGGVSYLDCTRSLQLRFNPAKLNYQGSFWRAFQRLVRYCNYKVLLKEIDLAYDLPYAPGDVFVWSKTGRTKDTYQGTEYFGRRHSDGYLKKYDKAKEQKVSGFWTRVEVTLKDSVDDTEMLWCDLIRPELDKYYTVMVLRSLYGKTGASNLNLKAVALGLIHGYIDKGELPKRRKSQVQDYIKENYVELDLQAALVANWKNELVNVKKFIFEEIYLIEKKEKGK